MHNLSNMGRYFLKLSKLKYIIYNILFYFIILFKFIIIEAILFEILMKRKKKSEWICSGRTKNKQYRSKMAAVYYEKKKKEGK